MKMSMRVIEFNITVKSNCYRYNNVLFMVNSAAEPFVTCHPLRRPPEGVSLHVKFFSPCPSLPPLLFSIAPMVTVWIMDRMDDRPILSVILITLETRAKNITCKQTFIAVLYQLSQVSTCPKSLITPPLFLPNLDLLLHSSVRNVLLKWNILFLLIFFYEISVKVKYLQRVTMTTTQEVKPYYVTMLHTGGVTFVVNRGRHLFCL